MNDLILYIASTTVSMLIFSIIVEQVPLLRETKAKMLKKYKKNLIIIALLLTIAVLSMVVQMLGNMLGLSYQLTQIISGVMVGLILAISPYSQK